MFSFFKKKTLTGLMASFITLADNLRTLADERLAEAAKNEAKARELMAQVEADEVEAEEALAAADRIEELVGGSAVLEAAAEKL